MNLAYPSVNEQECSWANIEIAFSVPEGGTLQLVDIEAIKWSRKVEVGESKGTSGGRVMKRTAGTESCEASASVLRSGGIQIVEALEPAAEALGLVRGDEVAIGGVTFDVLIQHTPLGTDRIYTAKLLGCRYLGDSDDMKQGNDADMVEITLNPVKILTLSKTGRWIALR